jgi:hypothetical protein
MSLPSIFTLRLNETLTLDQLTQVMTRQLIDQREAMRHMSNFYLSIIDFYDEDCEKYKALQKDLKAAEKIYKILYNIERKLTQAEQKQILDSCLTCAQTVNIHQDFSIRYQSKGFEYFTSACIYTLHKLIVPTDSQINNVIGNMNYTEHYKSLQ